MNCEIPTSNLLHVILMNAQVQQLSNDVTVAISLLFCLLNPIYWQSSFLFCSLFFQQFSKTKCVS